MQPCGTVVSTTTDGSASADRSHGQCTECIHTPPPQTGDMAAGWIYQQRRFRSRVCYCSHEHGAQHRHRPSQQHAAAASRVRHAPPHSQHRQQPPGRYGQHALIDSATLRHMQTAHEFSVLKCECKFAQGRGCSAAVLAAWAAGLDESG